MQATFGQGHREEEIKSDGMSTITGESEHSPFHLSFSTNLYFAIIVLLHCTDTATCDTLKTEQIANANVMFYKRCSNIPAYFC